MIQLLGKDMLVACLKALNDPSVSTSPSYTLHTTHYTLHTTHYTLHTTHYTLHTTVYLSVSSPSVLLERKITTPFLHSILYKICTLHILHFLHSSHFALHVTFYFWRWHFCCCCWYGSWVTMRQRFCCIWSRISIWPSALTRSCRVRSLAPSLGSVHRTSSEYF